MQIGSLFKFKNRSHDAYKNIVVGMDDCVIHYVSTRSVGIEAFRKIARNVIFYRMPSASFDDECEIASSIDSKSLREIFYTKCPTRLLQSQSFNWGEGVSEVDGKRLWSVSETSFDLEAVKSINKVYLYPFDGGRRDFRTPKLVDGYSCIFEPANLIEAVLKVQRDFESGVGHVPPSFGVGLYRAGCYKNIPSYSMGEFLGGEAMLKKRLNRGRESL